MFPSKIDKYLYSFTTVLPIRHQIFTIPNTNGCTWNSAQNASSWFKFIADATNVTITISGVTASLQILGDENSNQCDASATTVLNGSCPEDLANDTYISPRYSNGSANNNQLKMNGLTIGETDYFVVNGNGLAISPFYIEIAGASDLCSDVLPVELLLFQANSFQFQLFFGAGNSNVILNYQFTDTVVTFSPVYYRLKQTDFNGDYAFIGEDVIDCSIKNESLNLFMNYNHELETVNNNFTSTSTNSYRLVAYNTVGQLVFVEDYFAKVGENSFIVNTNNWREGIYFFQLIHNSKIYRQKIIIH